MPALPRPGRRAVLGAAYGGGGAWVVGFVGYGLLWGEAKYARRVVPILGAAPLADGEYGEADAPLLRLAMLGDSSGSGVGVETAEETPGALIAAELVAAGWRVELDVVAVSGARSADLDLQVARALQHPPDVAVITIGANDVTHKVPVARAMPHLADAVTRLRAAGALVVVGTCPDVGAVPPIPPPLRWVASRNSARMAAAQRVAVEAAGGIVVPLGARLGPRFAADHSLFCTDRFHPSAAGYRLIAAELSAPIAAGLGEPAALR